MSSVSRFMDVYHSNMKGLEVFKAVYQSMNLRFTNSVATMATDGVNLYVNLNFIDTLKDNEIKAILVHEAFHKLLNHSIRAKGKNEGIWNIATDLLINSIISRIRCADTEEGRVYSGAISLPFPHVSLKSEPFFSSSFMYDMCKKMGIPYKGNDNILNSLTAECVYDWLIEKTEEIRNTLKAFSNVNSTQSNGSSIGESEDESNDKLKGENDTSMNDEDDTSMNDEDDTSMNDEDDYEDDYEDDEPSEDSGENNEDGELESEQNIDKPLSEQEVKDWIDKSIGNLSGQSGVKLVDIYWSEHLPPAKVEEFDLSSVENLECEIQKLTVDGFSKELMAKDRQKFSLKNIIEGATAFGKKDYSYTRINRRTWGINKFADNKCLLPSITPQLKMPVVDVWVDTSGSMEDSTLQLIMGDLRNFTKDCKDYELNIYFFSQKAYDPNIHVSPGSPLPDFSSYVFPGRTGTSFDAIHNFYKDKKEPDTCIIMTDGVSSLTDEDRIIGRKTIWLIEQENIDFEAPNGKDLVILRR